MTATRALFPDQITLSTLDDLFAWHRATFGGFRMEDGDDKDKGDDKNKGGDSYTPPATQADLDRILGERLAREREKYADYDALKAKADAADKAAESAMTDAEKKVADARREATAEATEKANGRLIRSEARALAAAAKFRDPADAVAFLDLADVKVGDDGEVDSKTLKAALDKLAEDKPYLVDDGKAKPKPDRSQGGGGSGDTPSVDRGREMFENRRGAKKAS